MKIADAVFRPEQETLTDALEAACRAIAPTWPLDRFIAVNLRSVFRMAQCDGISWLYFSYPKMRRKGRYRTRRP